MYLQSVTRVEQAETESKQAPTNCEQDETRSSIAQETTLKVAKDQTSATENEKATEAQVKYEELLREVKSVQRYILKFVT